MATRALKHPARMACCKFSRVRPLPDNNTARLSTRAICFPLHLIPILCGTYLVAMAPMYSLRSKTPLLQKECRTLWTLSGRGSIEGYPNPQRPLEAALARAVVKIPDGELGRAPHGHRIVKGIRPGNDICRRIGRKGGKIPPFIDVLQFLRQGDKGQGDVNGAVGSNSNGLAWHRRQGIQRGTTGGSRRTAIERVAHGKVLQGDARDAAGADPWQRRVGDGHRGTMIGKRLQDSRSCCGC